MKKYILLFCLIPSLAFGDRNFFNFASSSSITSAGKDKIVFGIGDGTNVITTGVKKTLSIPYACTITGWTLLSDDPSDTAGAIVIDVWKDTYANFPPTVADTIIPSGTKPTITATGTKGVSSSLTGWTTSIAAGDVLRFNVDSVASLKSVTLTIACSK